jgi:hypothetical protein
MRARLAGLMLAVCAAEAEAGAWPREEGTAFVSLSNIVTTGSGLRLFPTDDLHYYGSLYAEYGLRPELTVGLDAAFGLGDGERLAAGLLTLRRPFWRNETGQIAAAEIGLGFRDHSIDGIEARIRPGLSWGKGFESRWGGGWAGIETSLEWRVPSNDFVAKADVTLGIRPSERAMLILQIQSGHYGEDGALVTLAPSAVWRIGETSHVQLGVNATLLGEDAVGVKLANWFSF